MRTSKLATFLVLGVMCLAGASMMWQEQAHAANPASSAKAMEPVVGNAANAACLNCHGKPGFSAPGANGQKRPLHVIKDKFGKSVHGERACIECHTDITETPHKPGVAHRVGCVACHQSLWDTAKAENKTGEHARLGVVVEQIDHYAKSIHARPSKNDPSRANANCYDCHDSHYVYPVGSPERQAWRLSIPNVCGKCHAGEVAQYAASVHGKAVLENKNPAAAICSDCHTTHDVADPATGASKLTITKNCGNCHTESLRSYTGTYHGQVNNLGYAYTAKCFDCHGSHAILRTIDPKSQIHPANRLKTCQQCHERATPGFISFEPHGTADNFSRYPYLWITSKLMLILLAGIFTFFWVHAALWFYREFKERRARKSGLHVKTDALLEGKFKGRHYQRFPLIWRSAHLIFALSLMILTLTGMSVYFSDTAWAPVVIDLLGGPKVAAVIHRTCAVLFAIVLVGQFIYFVVNIAYDRKPFDWLGPNSLAPRVQDLRDILSMVKWFLGLGPRPVFDHWTYWQKFDYWAPLGAVIFIGATGMILWSPNLTASFLPGWVFNVATILHGEYALLAVLFLFTVHFFNNHFRPDKFPLNIVMFTGSMPLEEFKREHRVEYNRLVASGELEAYLVDPPSRPETRGAKILGFTLIAFGLALLVLVLIGIYGRMTGA